MMDSRLIFRPPSKLFLQETESYKLKVLLDLLSYSEGFQWSVRSFGFDRDNSVEHSSKKILKKKKLGGSVPQTDTGRLA